MYLRPPKQDFRNYCVGESGDPLVALGPAGQKVLIGIVSYNSFYCNTTSSVTIFTRTEPYIDWIKENLN